MSKRWQHILALPLEAKGIPLLGVAGCLGEYTRKMNNFAGQRRLDDATTELNRLRRDAAAELERKDMAELLEAIEFYEKYGYSPPGYEISVEIQH